MSREHSLASARNWTPAAQLIARHYTDWDTPALDIIPVTLKLSMLRHSSPAFSHLYTSTSYVVLSVFPLVLSGQVFHKRLTLLAACLIFLPWRWRQYFPPTPRWTSSGLYEDSPLRFISYLMTLLHVQRISIVGWYQMLIGKVKLSLCLTN
jgi:hypothetical protein